MENTEKAEALETLKADLDAYFVMNKEFVELLPRIQLTEISDERAEQIQHEIHEKLIQPLWSFANKCEELGMTEAHEELGKLHKILHECMGAFGDIVEGREIGSKYAKIDNMVTSFKKTKAFLHDFLES